MTNLTLYGRANCSHCEQLRFALDLLKNGGDGARIPPYVYIDVDTEPLLQEKYGLQVPVLVYGSKTICSGVFDIESLEPDLISACAQSDQAHGFC